MTAALQLLRLHRNRSLGGHHCGFCLLRWQAGLVLRSDGDGLKQSTAASFDCVLSCAAASDGSGFATNADILLSVVQAADDGFNGLESLIFGSLISATDPVTVLAIFGARSTSRGHKLARY